MLQSQASIPLKPIPLKEHVVFNQLISDLSDEFLVHVSVRLSVPPVAQAVVWKEIQRRGLEVKVREACADFQDRKRQLILHVTSLPIEQLHDIVLFNTERFNTEEMALFEKELKRRCSE